MAEVTVSSLIARHIGPLPGETPGVCYICGIETAIGHPGAPSDLFTAWAACGRGDARCPDCAACLSHRAVRMRSWLVTETAFRPVTPDDKGWLWDALLSPPEPPYALYLTRGGQKQGWISGVRQVSLSRETPIVLTDWTDRPLSLPAWFRQQTAPVIASLRARKVSKRALVEGAGIALESRALAEGWRDELRDAAEWIGDPRWEAMVHACT